MFVLCKNLETIYGWISIVNLVLLENDGIVWNGQLILLRMKTNFCRATVTPVELQWFDRAPIPNKTWFPTTNTPALR